MNHFAFVVGSSAALALSCASTATAQCRFDPAPTTPLLDLTGMYAGETGGLYGNGDNRPPASHEAEAVRRAEAIAPIDGAIVMISVGMSNTTQEFSRFVPMAMGHADVNPALIVVDGAQGGQPAAAWTDPGAMTWRTVTDRLTRGGVRPNQVQVAWVKQAQPGPRAAFPTHAQNLRDELVLIARALRTNYPNIQLAFFSSRTRACTDGSDGNRLNPEPYAYESAFSVRWMIDMQIAGDGGLDPDTNAPLLAWGPYIWANETPNSDGFSWSCAEVRTDDCTHPSSSGQQRVAAKLLDFFTTDPMATPWFLRGGVVPPVRDAGAPTDSGVAGTDAGAATDAGGPSPDSSTSTPPPAEDDGCGCSTARGAHAMNALALIIALMLIRRRT